MPVYRQLIAKAADQHGLLTPDDARAAGIRPQSLPLLAHRGVLEHLGYGVYRVPELAGDPLAQYQEALLWARVPATLSHDTALDLHQLSDINPSKVHITVMPPGTFRRRAVPDWLVVHRGRFEENETTWLEGMRITAPGRTIRDAIESHVAPRFIDEALQAARERGLLTTAEQRKIETLQLRRRLAQLEAR